MARKRISRARLRRAIPGSGGVIAVVARRCGYSWHAVRDAIRADPELSVMLADEEAVIDDQAQSVLIDLLQRGDAATARWWLAKRRRAQFGDRTEATTPPGEPLHIRLVWDWETGDDERGGSPPPAT